MRSIPSPLSPAPRAASILIAVVLVLTPQALRFRALRALTQPHTDPDK